MNNDERIEKLEIKLAYQEDMIQQLSSELYKECSEREKLQLRFEKLQKKLDEMEENTGHTAPADQRPPHY